MSSRAQNVAVSSWPTIAQVFRLRRKENLRRHQVIILIVSWLTCGPCVCGSCAEEFGSCSGCNCLSCWGYFCDCHFGYGLGCACGLDFCSGFFVSKTCRGERPSTSPAYRREQRRYPHRRPVDRSNHCRRGTYRRRCNPLSKIRPALLVRTARIQVAWEGNLGSLESQGNQLVGRQGTPGRLTADGRDTQGIPDTQHIQGTCHNRNRRRSAPACPWAALPAMMALGFLCDCRHSDARNRCA